ncbi:MAG: hypothetical protein E8D42_07795 [Nitrospira sp.]|nr:MAG: hypothetical protein E8D42_07795 [Nitrospira sp.]
MSKLTAKRERFCQEMMKPKANQSDAYRAAFDTRGMKAATVHSEASRLMRDPQITARIAELRAPAVKRLQLSREQWLKKMGRMAMADVRKIFKPQGDVKEIHEIGDAEADLIESIEVTENFARVAGKAEHIGYVKKLRLTSKRSVLKDIGEAQGWLDRKQSDQPMRQNNSVTVNCFTLSEEEVDHVEAYGSLNGFVPDDGSGDGGGVRPDASDAAGHEYVEQDAAVARPGEVWPAVRPDES